MTAFFWKGGRRLSDIFKYMCSDTFITISFEMLCLGECSVVDVNTLSMEIGVKLSQYNGVSFKGSNEEIQYRLARAIRAVYVWAISWGYVVPNDHVGIFSFLGARQDLADWLDSEEIDAYDACHKLIIYVHSALQNTLVFRKYSAHVNKLVSILSHSHTHTHTHSYTSKCFENL